MSENRKEHRFKAVLPISVTCAGSLIKSNTSNLSRLGTYTEIDRWVPPGENVEVALELPAYTDDSSLTGQVKCTGSIFRSVPLERGSSGQNYGVGIFFTGFSSHQHQEKLSRFIDYLAVKEEQEIKSGLKKMKEKEETAKIIRHPEELSVQEELFRKEALNLLHKISSQLDQISRLLQPQKKAE
jgi:hypothetical protein